MPENSSDTNTFANIAGLLLAGGKGARLGGADKAGLRVGGVRLLDRAVRIMERQCATMFLAGGPAPGPASDRPPVHLLRDPGQGPAAALLVCAAEIRAIRQHAELLLLSPVDAPFAPADFADEALRLIGDNVQAIAGRFAGQTYPTHALWRLDALLSLSERLPNPASGSLFGLLDISAWRPLDYTNRLARNPFANINTPADLVACNRRAAAAAEPAKS